MGTYRQVLSNTFRQQRKDRSPEDDGCEGDGEHEISLGTSGPMSTKILCDQILQALVRPPDQRMHEHRLKKTL
eukprot:gene8024-biopygen14465